MMIFHELQISMQNGIMIMGRDPDLGIKSLGFTFRLHPF